MGKLTFLIFLCVAICSSMVAGQQPQPQPVQAQQQAPNQQQQRRNIIKAGDLVPEYDPLAPAFLNKPQLAYGKPALVKPPFTAASNLLKPGVQYGYVPMKPELLKPELLKPELLKPELLFKHEIFQLPEFKQLLISKPELVKPEFAHLLLAHMQNFLNQKLALLKPALTHQLPYQPIPLDKYNQQAHLSKPGLLEAELLKHKQFPSVYGEVSKEHLKPELTNLLTPIHKPQILSPSLPPQLTPSPQFESPPLNQVPQLFVPIPAVQQPAQVQPQPLQPSQQPALLPGFEFLNQLPGFAGFPGLTSLPGFNLPTLPTFDTSCLLHGNCSFGLPTAQVPQQPQTLNALQPSQTLQPGLSQFQPNPVATTSGDFVVEEQKRANLVVNENELSPEATIGACMATPREPLNCGHKDSDWDEVYQQHISCPTAPPRVWKCHCGFYKVPAGSNPPITSGPGPLLPGPSPPTPAGLSSENAAGLVTPAA